MKFQFLKHLCLWRSKNQEMVMEELDAVPVLCGQGLGERLWWFLEHKTPIGGHWKYARFGGISFVCCSS